MLIHLNLHNLRNGAIPCLLIRSVVYDGFLYDMPSAILLSPVVKKNASKKLRPGFYRKIGKSVKKCS